MSAETHGAPGQGESTFELYLCRNSRSPDGWVAFRNEQKYYTLKVRVFARDIIEARGRAIDRANDSFAGLSILEVNREDHELGAQHFPELDHLVPDA